MGKLEVYHYWKEEGAAKGKKRGSWKTTGEDGRLQGKLKDYRYYQWKGGGAQWFNVQGKSIGGSKVVHSMQHTIASFFNPLLSTWTWLALRPPLMNFIMAFASQHPPPTSTWLLPSTSPHHLERDFCTSTPSHQFEHDSFLNPLSSTWTLLSSLNPLPSAWTWLSLFKSLRGILASRTLKCLSSTYPQLQHMAHEHLSCTLQIPLLDFNMEARHNHCNTVDTAMGMGVHNIYAAYHGKSEAVAKYMGTDIYLFFSWSVWTVTTDKRRVGSATWVWQCSDTRVWQQKNSSVWQHTNKGWLRHWAFCNTVDIGRWVLVSIICNTP